MPLVLSFAHDMPIVLSDGLDFPSGDILPAGCWVLVGFAKEDIGLFEGGKITEAFDVLCTARPGVPKRTYDQVSLSLYNFRPSNLPSDMFNTLRALPCRLNSDIHKWNPKRLSLAVSIRELWHWCTSRKRCTKNWLLPTPFFDLAGFQTIPARSVAGQVLRVLHANMLWYANGVLLMASPCFSILYILT
jgi:hypothetical protein